jgi:sulfate permease
MSPVEILLLAVAAFFALNMGGSGFAPAFAVALGSKTLSRRTSTLLYGAFVMLGALLLGNMVAKTLSSGIVPEAALPPYRALIVLGAATSALFVANYLKVPQSTSWVTIFALAGLGLVLGELNQQTILWRLLPAWIGLPVLAYVITRLAIRVFYPLRAGNFRLHERLARGPRTLKLLVLATSCYVATAIGSNNVANVVGPMLSTGLVGQTSGFILAAPLFGLGAILFPDPARTVARGIVPLGPLAASLVGLVVGTLLFVASSIGTPQSLVQLNAAAVLAVWRVKNEGESTMEHQVIRKMFLLWLVTPVLAAVFAATATWLVG